MRIVAYLIGAGLITLPALPRVEQAVESFQGDLRRNLACTAATYAALADGADQADYDRAAELCPADPAYTNEFR